MRRLPVYLLLDSSGSMRGEPIESVRSGIQMLAGSLRRDPRALESVHLCIMTFDIDARVVTPLTSLDAFREPDIEVPGSGPTHLGLALERLCALVEREVQAGTDVRKGDWRPMLFVMTDGAVSDLMAYEEIIPRVRSCGFARIVACAAGPKARKEQLELLTSDVVTLETMDGASFAALFAWVSEAIAAGSGDTGADTLPPPPDFGGSPVL